MRLYSVQEFLSLGRPSCEGDVSQYAIELGDGWRMWATLHIFLLVGLLAGFMFGLQWRIVLFTFSVTLALPLIMTLGYLMGAKIRSFSIRDVLRIAYDHWKK